MIIIYVLEKNNIPIYVGKCNNINNRYSQHKMKYGDELKIKILDEVDEKIWKEKEQHYIKLYKDKGFILDNKNNGGGGPTFLSEYSRAKISKVKTGNLYKTKKLPEGLIEKLYETKPIQNIADELNLDFSTIQRFLKRKGIYKRNKNKPPISKETKEKFLKRKVRRSVVVIQCDLEGNFIKEYKSIKEACLCVNKPNREGDITAACRGKQKTAFGYIWKYKNDNK